MVAVTEARQAVEGGKPSASPIFRNPRAKDGFPALATGEKTLYDLWSNSATKHADNPCLGKRSGEGFEWMTYKQANEVVERAGSGLKKMGVEKTGRVGIFGQNSPEWMMSMQACNRQAFVCVPLYDTLGEVSELVFVFAFNVALNNVVVGLYYAWLLNGIMFFSNGLSYLLFCLSRWLPVVCLLFIRS